MHPSRLEPNFVICSYPLPGGHRTETQVFCQPDKSDLDAILAARGMGETYSLDGQRGHLRVPKMPSEHYYEGRLGDAMHAAVWVGMILNHCNAEAGRHAMLDTGVIHELSHLIEMDYDVSYAPRRFTDWTQWGTTATHKLKLWERLRTFERLVPGLHPRNGLHPSKQHLWDDYEFELREQVLARTMSWPYRGLVAFEGFMLREAKSDAAMAMTVTGRMGAKPKPLNGRTTDIIVLDDYSFADQMMFYRGNHEDFVLKPKEPLPNQRQFEMGRVGQGQTAKEKRVAACVSKLKAAAEPPLGTITGETHTVTAHKAQGSTVATAAESAFMAAMNGGVGVFYRAFDPAKPGAERTSKMMLGIDPSGPCRSMMSNASEGVFPLLAKPFKQKFIEPKVAVEFDTSKALADLTTMIDSFEAVEAMHRRMAGAVVRNGSMRFNGKDYEIKDPVVSVAGAA